MVRHIADQWGRLRSATIDDPEPSTWPNTANVAAVENAPAGTYSSPFAAQAAGTALSDHRGRIGGSDDPTEPVRRPEDWILDLVEALPLPVKSALPLIGALIGVLMLFRASAVAADAQGIVQVTMVALGGLLAGHIVQCCSVGALLLVSRVFAAGPAILKGLLVVGVAAGLIHVLGAPAL